MRNPLGVQLALEMVLCFGLVYVYCQHKRKIDWLERRVGGWKAQREKWVFKAKTPCHCPLCLHQSDSKSPIPAAKVIYQSEKAKRGRPKKVKSEVSYFATLTLIAFGNIVPTRVTLRGKLESRSGYRSRFHTPCPVGTLEGLMRGSAEAYDLLLFEYPPHTR